MKRSEAIETLRRSEPALRRRGVKHAALFGSVARGDDRPDSDIDIMIEVDPDARITVFDYLDLKEYIAGLFDGPVDVVNRESLNHMSGPSQRPMPYIPSERADGPLRDILHHIDLAMEFVQGFDREAFKLDLRTVYAVTRCLEIISEASRRLPGELKARHLSISWKQMAGAGNIYRHDYEDVAAPICLGHRAACFAASKDCR